MYSLLRLYDIFTSNRLDLKVNAIAEILTENIETERPMFGDIEKYLDWKKTQIEAGYLYQKFAKNIADSLLVIDMFGFYDWGENDFSDVIDVARGAVNRFYQSYQVEIKNEIRKIWG